MTKLAHVGILYDYVNQLTHLVTDVFFFVNLLCSIKNMKYTNVVYHIRRSAGKA